MGFCAIYLIPVVPTVFETHRSRQSASFPIWSWMADWLFLYYDTRPVGKNETALSQRAINGEIHWIWYWNVSASHRPGICDGDTIISAPTWCVKYSISCIRFAILRAINTLTMPVVCYSHWYYAWVIALCAKLVISKYKIPVKTKRELGKSHSIVFRYTLPALSFGRHGWIPVMTKYIHKRRKHTIWNIRPISLFSICATYPLSGSHFFFYTRPI